MPSDQRGRKPGTHPVFRPSVPAPARLPLDQMREPELRAWIDQTRAALQRKLQRERAYLDRRAARGTRTPTDDVFEQDQALLVDLLALLDEMEHSLGQSRP